LTEPDYKGARVLWEDISEDKVFMCDPETKVSEIAKVMVAYWIDTIFVVNKNEELLGVITDGVLLTLMANNKDYRNLKAKDVMAKIVYSVNAKEQIMSYERLKKTFSKRHNRVNRIAIVDDKKRLVGVLNMNFLKKIGRFSRFYEITLKRKERAE